MTTSRPQQSPNENINWTGLTEEQHKKQLKKLEAINFEKSMRHDYERAKAEGFPGSYKEYVDQYQYPFNDPLSSEMNPKFRDSWDGQAEARKEAKRLKEAGPDKQELKL